MNTSSSPFGRLNVGNSFAGLPGDFYTALPTQPLVRPRLLHANPQVAQMLGLSTGDLASPGFLDVVAGNQPLPGGMTLAAVYSGHQFGVWAGQLGDGRAHLLGEIITDHGPFELQLKGSGMTPYSRRGDGRAVVRSSVREYLAAEAMAGLGIPTTRSLALVVADDPIYRESVETAAVVARVSPSFVRFGSFEHWANHPEHLKELLEYVVQRFYPQCAQALPNDDELGGANPLQNMALKFLGEVVRRSARLVADWQTVGFCHGVMNTDNMSVLGLTLDYGPYGFMDAFQVNHICNHTDTHGRYAWNVQPSVMNWNLYRLASALTGLDIEPDALKAQLQEFEPVFLQAYRANLVRKFGLTHWDEDTDAQLVDDWWRLLHTQSADFTLSFRYLAQAPQDPALFLSLFTQPDAAQTWLAQYTARLAADDQNPEARVARMNAANPLYVLRNHLAQQAIDAALRDDATEIETLLMLLQDPFTERPGFEAYAAAAPDWARGLAVSCSS